MGASKVDTDKPSQPTTDNPALRSEPSSGNSAGKLDLAAQVRAKMSKRTSLVGAFMANQQVRDIISRAHKASPPRNKKSALQMFRARARKLIEKERKDKEADAQPHPALEYLNQQAFEYLK